MRVLVVLVSALAVAACGGDDDSTPTGPSTPRGEYSQTDLVVGTGTEATNGRLITVNYTGWLYNPNAVDSKGTQFDSSLSPGRGPYSFVLGTTVIAGWNRGVPGMRVGGRRRLVIPPELAYGAGGSPPTIGPNATLVFDIELLNVQ